MHVQIERIDVTDALLKGITVPTAIIRRDVRPKSDTPFLAADPAADGVWYVPQSRVAVKDGKPEFNWATTKQGEFVAIPLFKYETTETTPDALYGAGLQIGAVTLAGLPQLGEKDKLVLVLGNVFQVENKFEFYCGVAVRI